MAPSTSALTQTRRPRSDVATEARRDFSIGSRNVSALEPVVELGIVSEQRAFSTK